MATESVKDQELDLLAKALFEKMKVLNDANHEKVDGKVQPKDAGNDPLIAEQTTKISGALQEIEDLKAEVARQDSARTELEARMKVPVSAGSGDGEDTINEVKRRAYVDVLRFGQDADMDNVKLLQTGLTPEQAKKMHAFAKNIGVGPKQLKLLSTVSGPAGAYLVPTNIAAGIIELLTEFDPMRELATIVSITQGDQWDVPKQGSTNFGSGWVSETGSRAETTSGDFATESVPGSRDVRESLCHQEDAGRYVVQHRRVHSGQGRRAVRCA